MGYDTKFKGVVSLQPPLTGEQIAKLRDFAETRHSDSRDELLPGMPGLYCQWIPTRDGSGIEWDGGEKFYESLKWMKYLMEKFITPWGIKADGEMVAQGHDISDRWLLRVKDNVVTRKKLR